MILLDYNPHIAWIKKRIQSNKNCIGVFLGSTGSGKTFSSIDLALEVAKELGTTFTIEKNMSFNFKDALKQMSLPENEKAGTVFLLEEVGSVGSGGASSEWMSKANAFFSSFLQTSRHRNQVLLFTTPNFSLLTKQARMLIHFTAEMVGINKQNNTATARIKLCQTNPISGKTYMKYLRVKHNNQVIAITFAKFHLPPKEIIEEYEKQKRIFTDNLNKYILDTLQDKDDKVKEGRWNNQHTLPYEREEGMMKASKLRQQGLSLVDIAKVMGVNKKTIGNWLNQLRTEGDAPLI